MIFSKSVCRVFALVLLAGLMGMLSCQNQHQTAESSEDSSLISSAYAQDNADRIQQNTADLYNSRQNAITRAVARVSDAVVGINVIQVQRVVRRSPFMDDPFWQYFFPELFRDQVYERKVESLGSGFIISEDGYVVTNEHVVGNAAEIIVTMTNGRRYEAHLVGSDYLTDIALLKIEGEDLPYIEFGDSDNLIVGEWVIALGNPFGLFELNDKPTVTVGVISAVDRDWGRTNDGRLYMDMIQTDAAINRGNSGGPLVNSLGQVIGMNAFIYTGSQYEQGFVGIGFAIPINKIKEVVAELRDRGQINRQYWLGIYDAQDVTPMIVAALELPVDYGVIISSLARNGPAYKAGLRQYDVIIEVQGTTVHNQREMLQVLRSSDLKVGDKIRVKAIRNGEVREFTITLEAMRNSR